MKTPSISLALERDLININSLLLMKNTVKLQRRNGHESKAWCAF